MQDPEKHALVALGANMPLAGLTPAQLIDKALDCLDQAGLTVVRRSSSYVTPCFPPGAGPDYVNAAAVLALPPGADAEFVLQTLHGIEAELGRVRQRRWEQRTLDIDLLAIEDMILPDAAMQAHWRNLPPDEQRLLAPDRLILPHPRMQDRAFVLVPLADVAPDWVHPALKRTVRQMLADLPAQDRADVRRF